MIEQLTGAASVAVIVLAYVLVVQAMMAAIVLLSEFIVLRIRALWTLVEVKSSASAPVVESDSYRVGGGLMKW
jgi:hypothetical protein